MSGDAEMAVHVLAQLHDGAVLKLDGTPAANERIRQVAAAYGLDERVELREVRSHHEGLGRARLRIEGTDWPLPRGSFASVVHTLSKGSEGPTRRGRDEVLRGTRVAVVTNRPAHYRLPLFDGLDRRLRAAGSTFRAYFLGDASSERPWLTAGTAAFEREYVPSLTLPTRTQRRPDVPLRLGAALASFRPTIVLVGGLSPLVAGRVARIARRRRAAVGVWSGDVPGAPTAHGWLRQTCRRRILASVDFAVTYGWGSARYVQMLAPSVPIVVGRNTSPLPDRARQTPTKPPILIAVGDLASTRKGLDVLVDAMARLPDLECELRLVGGGRLLPTLAARAQRDPRITILGPLMPDETRTAMTRAQIYLFPTRFDVFGLSLVEAMGCGLASVVTPYSGAVEDLCVPDVNCMVIDGHDPADWARAIGRVAADAVERVSLGRVAAATVAARWTLDHAIDAMIAGLRLGAMKAH